MATGALTNLMKFSSSEDSALVMIEREKARIEIRGTAASIIALWYDPDPGFGFGFGFQVSGVQGTGAQPRRSSRCGGPETRIPTSETRNPDHVPKPKNSKSETRNPKPGHSRVDHRAVVPRQALRTSIKVNF